MKKLLLLILVFLAISLSGRAQKKAGMDSVKASAWHGTFEVNLNFAPITRASYDSVSFTFDQNHNSWTRSRVGTKNWGSPESTFDQGEFKIRTLIRSLPATERTVSGLTNSVRQSFTASSFEEKLGALAYLGGALELHYGKGEPSFNDLVSRLAAYQSGEDKTPVLGGDCRRYSFLTATVANKGFDFPSSVIGVRNHSMAQIINQDQIILLDYGSIVTRLDGGLLKNKDDVDAALVRWTERLTVSDLTMDPIKNIVSYENRYNNFAGLFKKLRNEDNTFRQRSFLMGDRNLEMFPQISAAGLISGDVRRGNLLGLQAYYLRDNNQYSRFLEGMGGLNLASCISTGHIGDRLSHSIFTDLGLYSTTMYLGWNYGGYEQPRASVLNLKSSVEDYLKYNLHSNWSIGLITKIGGDQELTRSGGNPRFGYTKGGNADENMALDGYISTSPFVSLEIPKSDGGTYLTIGSEVTDYLCMPNLGQISLLPWFQVGFKKANFDTSLRGEFQPASKRFDLISSLRLASSLLKLKVFYENFTPEFKKQTLFQDIIGVEAEIAKGFGRYQIFFSFSGEQENTGKSKADLNLGFRF